VGVAHFLPLLLLEGRDHLCTRDYIFIKNLHTKNVMKEELHL
jgi:hypothetical protein